MVRIHVVRASRLILGALIAVLVGAALFLFAGRIFGGNASEPANRLAGATNGMAETEAAVASASAIFADAESANAASARREAPPRRVLIYHTHTHEAYKKQADDAYVETAAWRTKDNLHNVVFVGERLAEELTARGFAVIHDVTDHELESLGTAYTRSLETMKSHMHDADIFIDLHRDAYAENGSGNPRSVTIDGKETARLMFLVGNGVGFTEKPYYAENFELATILTARINARAAGLCRPVMVKDGRYNQHVSPRSLLIEVGHNENTLEEALGAMPYLADALADVFLTGSPEIAGENG